MDCCVCYNNIKQSFITCHSLCKKCCYKIKNKKCPLCRNEMITKKEIDKIEVEPCYGSKKEILIKNLKKFVFGKEFKKHLNNVLSRTLIRYKDDFIIINYKKFNYDEILDAKTYTEYMISFGNRYCYYTDVFQNLIDRLILNEKITKMDFFYINNVITQKNYETPNIRLLKYICENKPLVF